MTTNYVAPSVEIVEIEIEDVVLSSSDYTQSTSLENMTEGNNSLGF